MIKIDPNFKYYLNDVSWPLALPLEGVGLAHYTWRCEYCLLSDRQTYAAIYYVCEKKLCKLVIKLEKSQANLTEF